MELLTNRCIIRKFNPEDAEGLYEVLSNKEVMKYIEPVFDMENTKSFIKNAGLCEPPRVYAVELKETGRIIGHLVFHIYEKNDYEIGWIIHKDYWGIGIADELTKEVIKYAGALGIESLVIECDEKQFASKHIAVKNGFIYEKKSDNLELYRLIL